MPDAPNWGAPAPVPEVPRPGRWWVAASCSLVAAALAGASAFSAWWTIFISSTTGGLVSFRPGGTFYLYSVSLTNSAVVPYAAVGFGPIEALYQSILALALALAALGVLLGILASLVALGRLRSAGTRTAIRKLIVLGVVTAAFTLAIAPGLQPVLAERSSRTLGLCQLTNGTTPCTTFWGSALSASSRVTWGADVGWFLMLVSAVFSLLAWLATLPPRAPRPIVLTPAPTIPPPAA